jgi:hypothetical protein
LTGNSLGQPPSGIRGTGQLLGQAEDFQQPLGNRVRQEEDKVHECQGSYHHRNHSLYLFPS